MINLLIICTMNLRDLDEGSEIIIFESIFTSFEACWALSKIG
jgi:hypothetical protein